MEEVDAYVGREQAYVKHYFLDQYLEGLVYKVAGVYDQICYIDGFSGPWNSGHSNYADTSFSIGLTALRRAKSAWKKLGRDVQVSAHLVEKNAAAYQRLSDIIDKYPEIEIHTHHADFVEKAEKIAGSLPKDAFAFILIDPKGWRIPIKRIEPLLNWPNSEVVFNFMFDFINRFASMNEPQIAIGLDELILSKGWREELRLLEGDKNTEVQPRQRKDVLLEAFADTLKRTGGFQYVADTPILRPLANRVLYSLVFATRNKAGLEVFRDRQIKTLEKQESVRAEVQLTNKETLSGQSELFGSFASMRPSQTGGLLASELGAAKATILDSIPKAPESVQYSNLWPDILTKHIVRKTQVNKIVSELKRDGSISVEPWKQRQRIPRDTDRVSKP